ncbi:hypothetical protein FE781_02055 [Paenibacillus thermoaerophilus]|nr:hypothetical protein FE781_02055 [Paenibacillus thermoaerophilus]
MTVKLRTVIYQSKVEIENVPIFTCEACQRTEVVPGVKDELTGLIHKLGQPEFKHQIRFEDVHELAHLMQLVLDKNNRSHSVEELVEERVNQLLDLLLLAQSLGDADWLREIRTRLAQIAKHDSRTYGLS